MDCFLKSYYDSTYGNCQRFNTGIKYPLRTVDNKNDALRLFVFLGLSTDPKILFDSWTNGVLISIDDQEKYPISLKKGIAIKPGTLAQIVIITFDYFFYFMMSDLNN